MPPDGGPKDTIPPTLVRAIPAPGSTQYTGNKVTLTFSEPIQVGPINTQLIIAPFTENTYKYGIRKGRTLELEFEKPFPENATITLNFRDAVKDLTEGNLAKNLVIAFATGPVLDTHAVAGQVLDLITGLPVDDALVGLWAVPTAGADTTSIIRQRPTYITRTDKSGAYVLPNLRPGPYFLAAMQDKNGNSRWNGKQEPVAFPSANLILSRDSVINLALAPLDEEPPRVFALRPSQDSLGVLTVNEGLVAARVGLGGSADSLPLLYDVQQGKLTFKLPRGLADSAAFAVRLVDSSLNRTDTLVGMRLGQTRGGNRRDRDEDAPAPTSQFTIQPTTDGETLPEPGQIRLRLSEPAASSQPLRPIRWQRDTLAKPVELRGYFEDRFRTSYVLQIPRLGYVNPRLILDSATFQGSFSRRFNQGDTVGFTIRNGETAGLIRGTIKDVKPPLIIQLLDEVGNKVIDTLRNTTRFEFRNLAPATYRIRVIQDLNNNGRWDQGSYRLRRQPERIIPFKEPIKVKANWEVELE